MNRFVFLLVAVCSLAACQTVRRVPVSASDSVRRDSIAVRYQRDTVRELVRDSVIIMQRADTVFVTRWRTLFRDRISLRTDTVYRDRVQTQARVEQVTIREDNAPGWHRFTGWWFAVTLLLLILFIVWCIITRNW